MNNAERPKVYGKKESEKHGLKSFICEDKYGNPIEISPKNEKNHSSFFPQQNDPHTFRNLGLVINSPDRYETSKSKTEKAQKLSQIGTVVVFSKDNYFEGIDSSYKNTFPNTTMKVVVFYGNDGNNHSLTYYTEPGYIGENRG